MRVDFALISGTGGGDTSEPTPDLRDVTVCCRPRDCARCSLAAAAFIRAADRVIIITLTARSTSCPALIARHADDVWTANISRRRKWPRNAATLAVATRKFTGVNPAGDAGDTSPQYFGWGTSRGISPQYYYVLSGTADQYWLPSVRSASSRFHSAIRRHQFASVRLTRLVPPTLNSRWRHCASSIPFHSIVLFQATRPIQTKQRLGKNTENQ